MVPWQQEDRNSTRTQLGSLDMKSKQLTMNETDGPKRQLSSAKYNLIKERLAAGWAGSGPAASRPSVGGRLGAATVGTSFKGCPYWSSWWCSARPGRGGQHRQGADNDVLGNYSGSLVSLFLVESIIFIICKELSSVPTGRMLETWFSAWDLLGEVANWIQTEPAILTKINKDHRSIKLW